MSGCGCHDVLVFGHGLKCPHGLGPVRQGGAPRRSGPTLWSSSTRYDPDTPRDIERPDTTAADKRRDEWLARNTKALLRQSEFRQSL